MYKWKSRKDISGTSRHIFDISRNINILTIF